MFSPGRYGAALGRPQALNWHAPFSRFMEAPRTGRDIIKACPCSDHGPVPWMGYPDIQSCAPTLLHLDMDMGRPPGCVEISVQISALPRTQELELEGCVGDIWRRGGRELMNRAS